mmetsp:Transcript_12575/g.39010  ORF Transcript_12575/g.39010 Transcript_12575/m.39010 type:complete len:221 (-) Transcript_12575:1064-1726(-)
MGAPCAAAGTGVPLACAWPTASAPRCSTKPLIAAVWYPPPCLRSVLSASATSRAEPPPCCTSADIWLRSWALGTSCSASTAMRGTCAISGSMSTLRLGVKGSGRRMARGKAESTRLRSCTHVSGMASQKAAWFSQRKEGSSCSSTSSTRSTPRYMTRMGSLSLASPSAGSTNLSADTTSRLKSSQPMARLASILGMKKRLDTSSSHAKANAGTRSGCTVR